MSLQLSGPDGLTLSDDPRRIDLEQCIEWLAGSYWASERSRDQVERSFAGSRVFGVYHRDGRQVALARAITDGATFCWIGDVFVDASVRGRGIGTWLVATVIEQLRADGVPRFLLGTRDAHQVYARLGFVGLRVPEVYMELDDRTTRPSRADVDPAVLAGGHGRPATP